MPGLSPRDIFLSYRHEDAAPYARLLQFQLSERIPDARIFIDMDSIEAGLDFAEVIREAIDSCAVLVALIGRQWATLADEKGRRRLDNPDDWVRFEVQAALERGVRVIPVLVDGAKMPAQQQLPDELHKLSRLHALELSYSRFQYDADRLLDLIQRVLAAAAGADTVHLSPSTGNVEVPAVAHDVEPSGNALPAGEQRAHSTGKAGPGDRHLQSLSVPNDRREPSPIVPADQALASELAAMDPADAAYALNALPGSGQEARKIMPGTRLQFRRVTGEQIEAEVRVDDVEFRAGEFLTARRVWLDDGTELRQHRVAKGSRRSSGYDRLDNEILAGRRLYEAAEWGYPPEVARLYGDEAVSADPYALFEPYQGEPLSEVVGQLFDGEKEAFEVSLLTGLCWLAAVGIAHRGLSPDTVLWDGRRRQVQITDFSLCTVFGAPREAIMRSPNWVAREQRSGNVYGKVSEHGDIWAAGRLIFFVRNQGEELVDRGQLADSGLGELLSDVFGPRRADRRPGNCSSVAWVGGTRFRVGPEAARG